MKPKRYPLINKNKFTAPWAFKEGVFQIPQGDFIVRIKSIHGNRHQTISRHNTKKDADKAFKIAIKKRPK